MNKNSIKLFFLIPAILLIIAPLISFPYGFYTLLRIIVTLTSAVIIYQSYKINRINEHSIIFLFILILYNPLIPIYLSREVWLPINFATSGIYLYTLFKIKKILSI